MQPKSLDSPFGVHTAPAEALESATRSSVSHLLPHTVPTLPSTSHTVPTLHYIMLPHTVPTLPYTSHTVPALHYAASHCAASHCAHTASHCAASHCTVTCSIPRYHGATVSVNRAELALVLMLLRVPTRSSRRVLYKCEALVPVPPDYQLHY